MSGYSTAFVPVQISNAGSPLKPITSSQYEVGVKYEPIGWDTAMTVSVRDLGASRTIPTSMPPPTAITSR